jgi:hypothetical protein
MAVAATLEILLTESCNLVSKSLISRKIAIDVDYDSSEDTKETCGVDGHFRIFLIYGSVVENFPIY